MPRAIWSGAVSFGLVSVPVKLYAAIKQKDVRFHQVEEGTGARIKYKRVSARTGREVPYEKIVKGFEADKDHIVVVKPEELEAIDPKKTHALELHQFVDLEDIDPIYYEHVYYLAPAQGGSKAYRLLLKALTSSKKVGIGKVVLRTKEYLAALRPIDNVLALHTMVYPDEIVSTESLDLPESDVRVTEREMTMAKQLIDSMSGPFEPEDYKDEYRSQVLDLIKKKAKDDTYTVEAEPEERAGVVDLMEALRASVEATGKRPAKRKATRRRKTA